MTVSPCNKFIFTSIQQNLSFKLINKERIQLTSASLWEKVGDSHFLQKSDTSEVIASYKKGLSLLFPAKINPSFPSKVKAAHLHSKLSKFFKREGSAEESKIHASIARHHYFHLAFQENSQIEKFLASALFELGLENPPIQEIIEQFDFLILNTEHLKEKAILELALSEVYKKITLPDEALIHIQKAKEYYFDLNDPKFLETLYQELTLLEEIDPKIVPLAIDGNRHLLQKFDVFSNSQLTKLILQKSILENYERGSLPLVPVTTDKKAQEGVLEWYINEAPQLEIFTDPIKGRGVRTKEKIPQNTKVLLYSGDTLSRSPFGSSFLLKKDGSYSINQTLDPYALKVGNNHHIIGLRDSTIPSFSGAILNDLAVNKEGFSLLNSLSLENTPQENGDIATQFIQLYLQNYLALKNQLFIKGENNSLFFQTETQAIEAEEELSFSYGANYWIQRHIEHAYRLTGQVANLEAFSSHIKQNIQELPLQQASLIPLIWSEYTQVIPEEYTHNINDLLIETSTLAHLNSQIICYLAHLTITGSPLILNAHMLLKLISRPYHENFTVSLNGEEQIALEHLILKFTDKITEAKENAGLSQEVIVTIIYKTLLEEIKEEINSQSQPYSYGSLPIVTLVLKSEVLKFASTDNHSVCANGAAVAQALKDSSEEIGYF